jgi:2-phosphosulfolactate phosphatase
MMPQPNPVNSDPANSDPVNSKPVNSEPVNANLMIRVDLLPSPPYDGVVVLVDVLRTCTVAPILFENGLASLHVATKLKRAREVAQERRALLLGERRGLPPEGFNYGNSPAELRGAPMTGDAVLVSDNAPVALTALAGAEHVLLGALYNAGAVVRCALELAQDRIYLVGSGLWGQQDLDDALTVGFLAALLKDAAPGATLTGAARLSMNLLKAFPDPLEAFWRSSSGHYLRKLDLADDMAVASLVSQTEHVPRLAGVEQGNGEHLYRFVSDCR